MNFNIFEVLKYFYRIFFVCILYCDKSKFESIKISDDVYI